MKSLTLPNGLDIYYLNLNEARFLYEETFQTEEYFKHGIALIDGACVFDVGANIGMFGIYLQRRWPQVRLYAFEPVPDVFAVLHANVARHGIAARLFDCALAAEPGETSFTYYPGNTVMSGRYADASEDRKTTFAFLSNKSPEAMARAREDPVLRKHFDSMIDHMFEARTITCRVGTLSQVLRETGVDRIDLLKIDVEKSEHEVLAGIADADWPKIRQLVVEVHDQDGRQVDIRRLLEQRGYLVEAEQALMLRATNLYTLYARRA